MDDYKDQRLFVFCVVQILTFLDVKPPTGRYGNPCSVLSMANKALKSLNVFGEASGQGRERGVNERVISAKEGEGSEGVCSA